MLRPDLPFRRIAVVLSGGGALGAYEVGVLKALESLRLVPWLVAGVSIGAVNAAVWLAHGRRTGPLEAAWLRMSASSLGLRWGTLFLRGLGALLVALAAIELLLLVTGSRELSGAYWLWRRSSGRIDLVSTLLDAGAWATLGALGFAVALLSRRAEDWLSRLSPPSDPERLHRIFGFAVLLLLAVHATVWVFGWPWPHRFSAFALLILGAVWLANRPGRTGDVLRRVLGGLMPETRGRGLWGSAARRRVLDSLMRAGDPRRIVDGGTTLVIGALATDTGRVAHFTTWREPPEPFLRRVRQELGEVLPIRDPEDAMRAAVASSAIPGVFEPVRIGGRDFVDAGGFSNQPLHVAIAAEADAVLVVLMTPAENPRPAAPASNLFELAGRLLEVANWRDFQTELRSLPPGWSREGSPARLCVVEPAEPLPGSVLSFAPHNAPRLIALGEADARRALERAGWTVPSAPEGE